MGSPQVIVITGASAGVGRATVREFARQGAKIGLVARGIDGLSAAKREVEELGGQAVIAPADVSDPVQVENAVRLIEESLGPIDAWVNNAMVSVFSPTTEMTPDDFKRVTEVTYLGYVYCTLAVLKRMRARNRGIIVQVGSALAYRSIPLQSAYCAAKHAIVGFTESLRCELLHDRSRIQVCNVQLPALNTPQFGWVKSRLPNEPQPVPPIFQPEVAAQAIAWIVKHPRREIWVGGPTLKAIIADKLVPGLADRYLARMGYSAQQTSKPKKSHRPDNLKNPVPGDAGAHGSFESRSKSYSIELILRTNQWKALLILTGLLAITAYTSRSIRAA